MRFFFLFLFFFYSLSAFSQPFDTTNTVELGLRPKPDENQIEVTPVASEKTPTLSDFDHTDLPDPNFVKKEGKSIFQKPQFDTPNFGIAEKINKDLQRENNQNLEQFKRNQYFGDFKTESKYIKLVYRDHIYFDGDRVQIILNDRIILSNVLLESSHKSVQIDLIPGFNKIEIVALNQGTSGPNTAEFQVYDDSGSIISSNQWELATGFKGTIILIKE